MVVAHEEHFLDFVMTNQSYVHEWGDLGWIYLQVFPHGKMYAGQSINITTRFKSYSRHIGPNQHHTRALKRHGWENVRKIVVEVPRFLMNRIESFLIEWYDLMDRKNGYNKQSGGTSGFYVSQETRRKISIASKNLWKNPDIKAKQSASLKIALAKEETKEKLRIARTGEKNSMYGKTKEQHPKFGKSLTDESKKKIRQAKIGEKNPMYGKKGDQSPNFSDKNSHAKPVFAFGKVFACGADASRYWRAEKAPHRKDNFIKNWTKSKKYSRDVFWISSKKFYDMYKDSDEYITREMYDDFILSQED